MLRLIHTQTISGPILLDDIDDGLPNKDAGHDGYANDPKQGCYVPRTHTLPDGSEVAGFLSLNQTARVRYSVYRGKIGGFIAAGLITGQSYSASSVTAPVVTSAATIGPDFVIDGTNLQSIEPVVTSVTFAQGVGVSAPSPLILTESEIVDAGGSITSGIYIPSSLFTTAPVAGNTVVVNANELDSNEYAST